MKLRSDILTWARGLLAGGVLLAASLGAQAQSANGTGANRIVSIGGAVTEILYDLGEDSRIVGIDTTSLYPPRAAKEKPSIGYMRQLSAEGVLSLRPDLILAIEGAGPKDTMAVLQAAKVPLRMVPERFTGDGILEKIKTVAETIGASPKGECLARKVSADLGALAKLESGIANHDKKRVMFVLSLINGHAMVAGHGTAADGIIRMAGAVNAMDGFDGYKVVSDEAVIAAGPDAVLTMQRTGSAITAESIFSLPAFVTTPAAIKDNFISMEGLYLLGFGPRTARAARDLAAKLYPGIQPVALPSEVVADSGTCTK